jgi:hypothetical protein
MENLDYKTQEQQYEKHEDLVQSIFNLLKQNSVKDNFTILSIVENRLIEYSFVRE